MFKRIAYVAAAAGVLAFVPAQSAKATVGCTSGTFNFCFSFTFSNNVIFLQFNPNGSGATSTGVMTDFGVFGYTPGVGPIFGFAFLGGQGWTAQVSGNGQCPGLGGGNDVGVPLPFQACVTPNPSSAGLFGNQFIQFNFTGNATANSGAEVHIQNVNQTNCSVHVNLVTMAIAGAPGDCGTTSTTPEPASMALVATGLLALGGSVIRRRRRE